MLGLLNSHLELLVCRIVFVLLKVLSYDLALLNRFALEITARGAFFKEIFSGS